MIQQIWDRISGALQSLFSTVPKLWTKEEARHLLHQVYFNRVTRPLEGRSQEECQSLLKAIMDPFLIRRSREAINVYHVTSGLSLGLLDGILREPREHHDNDIYYDVISVLLQLDGVSMDVGIKKAVEDLFEGSEAINLQASRSQA